MPIWDDHGQITEEGRRQQNRRKRNPAPPTTPPPTGTPTPPPPAGPIVTNQKDKTYTSSLNALMPFLSPSDQQTLSMTYGISVPSPTAEPAEITGDVRNAYLSSDRAQQALTALGSVAGNGAGINFLRNAIQLLKQYGGTAAGGMNREAYGSFSQQFNALMQNAQGQSGVDPYLSLAQQFLNPTFKTGQLMNMTDSGNPRANKKLYT